MHAAILHDQILRILQRQLIFGRLRQFGQIDAEKVVCLLVAVLEFVRLKHYHSIGQIVQNLSDAVACLFRLHLHHEELGHHTPN